MTSLLQEEKESFTLETSSSSNQPNSSTTKVTNNINKAKFRDSILHLQESNSSSSSFKTTTRNEVLPSSPLHSSQSSSSMSAPPLIPHWGVLWFLVSHFMALIDGLFVLVCHLPFFFVKSSAGGNKYHELLCVPLRQLYTEWDPRSSNKTHHHLLLHDDDPYYHQSQSILNLFESLLAIIGITLYLHGRRRGHQSQRHIQIGAKILLVVSIMTFYRTFGRCVLEGVHVVTTIGWEELHGVENTTMWLVTTFLGSLPWMVFPAVLAHGLLDRLYMRTKRVKFKQG